MLLELFCCRFCFESVDTQRTLPSEKVLVKLEYYTVYHESFMLSNDYSHKYRKLENKVLFFMCQ